MDKPPADTNRTHKRSATPSRAAAARPGAGVRISKDITGERSGRRTRSPAAAAARPAHRTGVRQPSAAHAARRRSASPVRRRGRRATAILLGLVAAGMVLTAIGLAVYPFYTDWRAARAQRVLSREFSDPGIRETYRTRRVEAGKPLTRILIPAISVDAVVVEGISLEALAAGAGHYQATPLPGEPGNVAIAGHRTMNGKPFANIDRLKAGDKVDLVTPFARHTYEVLPAFEGHANPWVTTPNDWTVIDQTPDAMLTLTTCHPKGSSKQRLVVRAKLVGSGPVA